MSGLKHFASGAALGFSLFLIATFAMGYYAGAHGIAAPQVDTTELQTNVSSVFGQTN